MNVNLESVKPVLFDGAFGTMLEKKGLDFSENPVLLNIKKPEVVREIAGSYADAGADVLTTNTFEANRYKIDNVEEVVRAAIDLLKPLGKKIALEIGPTGKLVAPMGDLDFDDAYECFSEIVKAGEGADMILLDTFTDLSELRAAILAAKDHSDLPVIASMSFSSDGRTFTGVSPESFATMAEALGVSALGVNCSLGPQDLLPVVEKILDTTSLPVIVQPNAGLPVIENGKTVYPVDDENFANYGKIFIERGATILGGCCGTTPETIRALRKVIDSSHLTPREGKKPRLSSYTGVLKDTAPLLIGERINPTGKERMKEALRRRSYDPILKEAVLQEQQGAHVIDVNLGLPEIDEKEVMGEVLERLLSVTDAPLCFDSSRPEVLEVALRRYPGVALINSVNASKESKEAILPLAAKYGSFLIGLTLDEDGIPDTSEGRVRLAEKIIEDAATYGIPKERIFIDALTLTAASAPARVTLDTVKVLSDKGINTVLGVSNVSFGLPERDEFNALFLSEALSKGLSAAIIDPGKKPMSSAVLAHKIFDGDSDSLRVYSNPKEEAVSKDDLKSLIVAGFDEAAKAKTKELLESIPPEEIIDTYFIPALDKVGKRYDKGEIFLPGLIQSAQAVQACFDLLRAPGTHSGEPVILATVKGDIHDIGKNILSMMLENYGFDVIDLGSDVEAERILKTAKEYDVGLIGLSALMTTTVESMKETITYLREGGYKGAIMVGGAVLTPDYAEAIGADYYGKDAKEGIKLSQEILGGKS